MLFWDAVSKCNGVGDAIEEDNRDIHMDMCTENVPGTKFEHRQQQTVGGQCSHPRPSRTPPHLQRQSHKRPGRNNPVPADGERGKRICHALPASGRAIGRFQWHPAAKQRSNKPIHTARLLCMATAAHTCHRCSCRNWRNNSAPTSAKAILAPVDPPSSTTFPNTNSPSSNSMAKPVQQKTAQKG